MTIREWKKEYERFNDKEKALVKERLNQEYERLESQASVVMNDKGLYCFKIIFKASLWLVRRKIKCLDR